MTGLRAKIDAARHLVIGAPIYFHGLPAQAKAFVDRCQLFWNHRRHRPADGETALRIGYFIATAATHSEKCFDGARLTLRALFATLGMKPGEELLVRGVDERGAVAARGEALAQALELGKRVGVPTVHECP